MRACGRRGGFRSDETGRGQQVGYGAQQAFLLGFNSTRSAPKSFDR